MHRLVSSLRVIIRQEKKSVLAALHKFMDISIEWVGYVADSRFRAQTSKKIRAWNNLALQLKPMRVTMFILVRASSISLSSDQFTGKFLTVLHPRRIATELFLYLLLIYSDCILSIASSVFFLFLRVLVFFHCIMDCEGQNINRDVFRYGAEPVHLFDIQSI